MRRLAVWLLLLVPALSYAAEPIAEMRKSLVRITTTFVDPDYRTPWNEGTPNGASGTGFIIEGNRVLTNAHVISNTRFLTVERENDPKKYVAEVKFVAHDCDLAVLSVADPHFFKDAVTLSLGSLPELESAVSVFGYPIGGDRLSVTRGVVSRVDFQLYTHSGVDSHLAIQIDAAINPGNSGGPVMQDNKVVGVAFQGYSGDVAQSTGYMIPTPVIRRFLKDIEDGHYDRYMDLSIGTFNLPNPSQRAALKLPDDDLGVMVSDVQPGGPAAGILQVGDVLRGADGHPVESDGTVELDGAQVLLSEIVERKFKDDSVKLDVWRDGKPVDLSVKFTEAWPYNIQANDYGHDPRYVLFGGLLFQPLSRDFMDAYQPDDLRLRYLYDYYITDAIYTERPEIVVLSAVLPDPINTYFADFQNGVVDEVNGVKIKRLADLAAAFAKPSPRIVIKLLGEGRPLVLDAAAVKTAQTRIADRYGVPKRSEPGRSTMKRLGTLFVIALCGGAPLRAAPGGESTPPADTPPVGKSEKREPQPVAGAIARVRDAEQTLSIIRVDSTVQPYDFVRPWTKKAPSARRGIGAVVDGGRILVTAGMVANASFVELETEENAERIPAKVLAVDYDADLALLEPADPKALQGRPPLQLVDSTVGDEVEIAQLESTGAQVSTDALVTTAAISSYPLTEMPLLSYRISVSLQYREGSYTLPVLRKGKLAGLLLRYESRSQTAEAISAPVIRHFLTAVAKKRSDYGGFPSAGLEYSPLRDPQLRRFAQAEKQSGGVYVTDVTPNGPAATGGIQRGDVLLSVAGESVDADGNFRDRLYGKIGLQHLISTTHFDQDSITFGILRDGKALNIPVTVTHRALDDAVIPAYSAAPPKYYVLGGLVLVELSRSYLREWGADWQKKAPERFVYLDRFQDDLYPNGGQKIVVLSQVLPTPLTIGDEQLGGLVITKVNDVPIKGLADLPKLLKQPVNGFQKLEFNEAPRVLYLDAAQADAIAPQVQQRYGLPAIQRLD